MTASAEPSGKAQHKAGEFLLICATIVPFLEDGSLDAAGTETLFSWLKAAGVRHVFTPGTTGEFTSLTSYERRIVIEAALRVFGSEGVFAHVGAAAARQAMRLAHEACDAGASRLAAITPYFVTAGPQSVYSYYSSLASEVPGCEVFAYVFRDRATTDVDPQLLRELAAIPGMRGAKISGLSNEAVRSYVDAAPPDFMILSGSDRDLAGLLSIGCSGVVSGVSSVFPFLFADAVAALNSRDRPERFREPVERAVDAVGAGHIGLLKAGLGKLGLPAGPLRVSLDDAGPLAHERLNDLLRETMARGEHA